MNDTNTSLAPGMLNKVPAVTLAFWAVKIMATTVGETAADFLNTAMNLGLTGTSLVMGALLIAALISQLRTRRYVPWIYWVTVVLISVAGTLITDNLTDHFGVPLPVTTVLFALALAATFVAWYAVERTLSIHTIHTRRRELFYWAAILFTFALGTAAGDLAAERMQLGYANSVLVFGAAIAVVAVGHFVFALSPVTSFWIAYILTRPLGASLGDLLSQPIANGGLGAGTAVTSTIFLAAILILIGMMTLLQRRAARIGAVSQARSRAD